MEEEGGRVDVCRARRLVRGSAVNKMPSCVPVEVVMRMRNPMAFLSATSCETGLGVVGEGSPLLGSAMGTFAFASAILARRCSGCFCRRGSTPVARMITNRCCYAPDVIVRPQLSKEL